MADLYEAWLGVLTANESEAIINDVQPRTVTKSGQMNLNSASNSAAVTVSAIVAKPKMVVKRSTRRWLENSMRPACANSDFRL